MTLDETIKYAEEVAEKNENNAQIWHKQTENRLVDFCDRAIQEENNCIKCAKEHRQLAEWLEDYKRLKEQESCEDTVNRQSVLDINFKQIILTTANPAEMIRQKVKALPPATPKRKVGEWIKKNNDYFDWYECSECGYGSEGEIKYNRLCDVRTKFCPDCGIRMIEPQSEDAKT